MKKPHRIKSSPLRSSAGQLEICILAGGLSTRMGRNKQLLEFGGETFLERIKQTARKITPRVKVITKDIVERCGPLGGVFTSLKTSSASSILFLSCDMPLVSEEILRKLIQIHQRVPLPVFTLTSEGAGFPFLLPRACVAFVEEQINNKRCSLQALCKGLHAAQYEPNPCELPNLVNINTPSDYRGLIGVDSSPPLLEIENLSIRRDKVRIVTNLNWIIRPGEHWVVLGSNGSGKTSILSALLGYMTPTSGTIRLLGEEFGVSDWRALRDKIGIVSSSIRQMMPEHEPALITVASGRYSMIDFWGEPTAGDRAQARKILRQIQCEYIAERPWRHLSQGERQRVLIGRALMASPQLLILDEPCAGLDPGAREDFLQFIEALGSKENSPGLVLVTHHVEEIMPIFTHALLLKAGTELASGPITSTLRSKTLSETFSRSIHLKKSQGRYTLTFAQPS